MDRFTLALALALALAPAPPAVAETITPGSITVPPPTASFTAPINDADFVNTQYAGLGLTFPIRAVSPSITYATAIATVEGTSVWAPVLRSDYGGGAVSGLTMDGLGVVVGDFTRPVGSVAADLVWKGTATGWLTATRADGSSLYTSMTGETGTHRLTLDGGGFVWFATGRYMDPFNTTDSYLPWGVAAVTTTSEVSTLEAVPEPGSLALAALGLLGVIASRVAKQKKAVRAGDYATVTIFCQG